MMDNYDNLCTFNFGKRSYIIMKNSIKVMYFENNAGKYEMPIVSFNLYDNMGKSLTVVNQHFFMSQLVNRLNISFKKGIFSNKAELVSFLSDLKSNIEKDDYLRKLFKGSFMKEIDEANFENNKREILKYLDSFKFDTFVNYNNVSIFTGSIEKNSDSDVSISQVSNDESIDDDNNTLIEESISDNDLSDLNETVDDEKQVVSEDISDLSSVDIQESDVVSSSDYFGFSSNSDSDNLLDLNDQLNNSQVIESNVQNNSLNIQDSVGFNDLSSLVSNENQKLDDFEMFTDLSSNIEEKEDIFNETEDKSLDSYMWGSGLSSNKNFDSVSVEPLNNVSYINDVKDRIQNSEPEVKNQYEEVQKNEEVKTDENVVLTDSVISDNTLESVNKDELGVNEENKKGKVLPIVFLIMFIIVLIGVSYYLYNNVF